MMNEYLDDLNNLINLWGFMETIDIDEEGDDDVAEIET